VSLQAKLSDCRSLPSDYGKPYDGTIERWADDDKDYPDCSCGCRFFAPLFNAESMNKQDGDFGVCLNQKGPRHGLLTFEHQAGFGCFAAGCNWTQQLSIDYYQAANATGKPVCFGCGRPDRTTGIQQSWAAIRAHLERSNWQPEDIAAEAERYRALVDADVRFVVCDDCFQFGCWNPGEAEQLHSRARRFAHESEADYWRRRARGQSWQDKTTDNPRFRAVSLAALRWAHVWLLNNPGSKLPYEAGS
jgi:hypothetical protein